MPASPPSWEETITTTPTNAVTSPMTPQLAIRSPRNARPSSSTKNGVVLTSTAAFPAPASVVPSAMPSKVSVTMSRPESAAHASGRPRGSRPRISAVDGEQDERGGQRAQGGEHDRRGVLGADRGRVERLPQKKTVTPSRR